MTVLFIVFAFLTLAFVLVEKFFSKDESEEMQEYREQKRDDYDLY